MSNVNTAAISGNLTRDVELRYTPSGTAIADLGVAVTRNRKDGDEWVEETSFFDVTVFGGRGEMCAKKLAKGSQVFVAGRLEQQRWEDGEGNKRSRVKIIATAVEGPDFFKKADQDNDISGAQAQASGQQQAAPETAASGAAASAQDDDIPF